MNDRRSNKLTPLEEELLDLRDRVEELQEAIRERDRAFAPEMRIPPEWNLTRPEAVTLAALSAASGKPVRRAGLLIVSQPDREVLCDETLDKTLSALRRKIAPYGYVITSVSGVGYSLQAPDAAAPAGAPAKAASARPDARKRPGGVNPYSEGEDAIIRAGAAAGKLATTIRADLIAAGYRRSCTKSIRARAAWIGVEIPTMDRRWSREEDEIVSANTDIPIRRVRMALAIAGFQRTFKAVASRRVDLGLQPRQMGLPHAVKQIVRACVARRMTDRSTVEHLQQLGHDVTLSQVKHIGQAARDKSRPGWTAERIAVLRDMIENEKRPIDVATALGLSNTKTVVEKARQLGLSFCSRLWSDDDVRTLVRMIDEKQSSIAIGRMLNRSPAQVVNKASRMGLGFDRWPEEAAWTDEKIALLRQASADGMRLVDAARMLDRGAGAVFQAARRFNISFSRERPNLRPLQRKTKTNSNNANSIVAYQ